MSAVRGAFTKIGRSTISQSNSIISTHYLPKMSSSSVASKFQKMSVQVNSLKNDPGNETKLKMYALFKQATQGTNTTAKPSAINFVAKAKWDAWSSLKDLSSEEAMNEYIKIVEDLLKAENQDDSTQISESSSKFETLLIENKNGIYKMTLNRPKKYNALTIECYTEIGLALQEAANDENVVIAVLTGNGPYYSAGNDLGIFQKIAAEHGGDMKKAAEEGGKILEKFVNNFIEFPKPLISLVNGPAVGISVTVLGLFDVVLASEKATFQTPFPSLGQTPEGCSSYTFPKMMGHLKAIEMLLHEKKLTPLEAVDRNLVTEVISEANFEAECMKKLEFYASLPKKSLMFGKRLMRQYKIDALKKINKKNVID